LLIFLDLNRSGGFKMNLFDVTGLAG